MDLDVKQFQAKIEESTSQPIIATLLKQAREQVLQSKPGDSIWDNLTRINSDIVDIAVARLFSIECAKAGSLDGDVLDLAIVATGGYGRQELAPYSDVDITFITAREDDDKLNAIIKGMFQAVMDVFLYGAGMKVGYAYRLVTDYVQLDHQTQTALLDSRLVVGNSEIFERFDREYRQHLLTADFLFQKNAERNTVLLKFGGDDPYVVEPNIKEGSGGLRDTQIVEWFGQVICATHRATALDTLEERHLISPDEQSLYRSGYSFLRSVRNGLHCASREARDVLTTEKQEMVARILDYEDTFERPAVEQFMADYYTTVGNMKRIARKVMKRCCDSSLPLGIGGLSSFERKIILSEPSAAQNDSALPLHACELAQAYQLDFGDTLDEDVRRFLAEHPQPERFDICGRVLSRIMCAPSGTAKSLRWLADQGVLPWVIPEFAGLRQLIPYDASHDHTVGEHSLHVVEFLERLKTIDEPRFAEYKRSWQEVDTPDVLYLAGLIHDIGKQWPLDGPHGESGARASERIGKRLGWSDENTSRLAFLVENHLLMAETSRLRDLRLDETIAEFTKVVDEPIKLHMLFLLTCADTHEVGDGVWTEMKAKLLSELFNRAENALTASDSENIDSPGTPFVPDLVKHRERIRKQLEQQNLPPDAIHEHTARMPAQYLLNTPLEEMYLHMAMINRLRSITIPIVDFKTEFGSDYTELTIVTYDDPHPGLLAKIFGVMYALDINLHASQVFTRDSSVRIAIDTLWIDFHGKPLSSAKKAEVQETIRSILTGKESIDSLFERRKKPHKEQVVHGAKIDDITSERYSLLEIRAPMEPGVIYRLAGAISDLGWNIHSARLSLWGSRVRAAFYVTDINGNKVNSSEANRLYAVLKREDAPGRRKPVPTIV